MAAPRGLGPAQALDQMTYVPWEQKKGHEVKRSWQEGVAHHLSTVGMASEPRELPKARP